MFGSLLNLEIPADNLVDYAPIYFVYNNTKVDIGRFGNEPIAFSAEPSPW